MALTKFIAHVCFYSSPARPLATLMDPPCSRRRRYRSPLKKTCLYPIYRFAQFRNFSAEAGHLFLNSTHLLTRGITRVGGPPVIPYPGTTNLGIRYKEKTYRGLHFASYTLIAPAKCGVSEQKRTAYPGRLLGM